MSVLWLQGSFLKDRPLPEADYRVLPGKGPKQGLLAGGGGGGGTERVEEEEEPEEEGLKGSDYVLGYPSKRGWLCSEEEELARYLASDPRDERSIWAPYQKSVSRLPPSTGILSFTDRLHSLLPSLVRQHPSRSTSAYREHHRKRKEEFFDARIAEFKAANDGQPIAYEHPEVVEVEVENRNLTSAL